MFDAVTSRLPYSRVLLSLVRLFLSAMDLNNLNKSSAKVADFPVSMAMGNLVEYTYQSKKDSSTVKAQKFEVYVVGQKPEAYCIGYVKGKIEDCRKAQEKFCNGSAWALSKVAFDPYTSASYISTSVPFRIDLTKSTLVRLSSDSVNSSTPFPPMSVADIARIKRNKCSDLIAMVKEVKRERVANNAQTIADVALIDNSEMKPGRLAVGGSQPLSCPAFLDYSSSTPEANAPEVVQLTWLHIEEPELTADVLH